MRLRRTASLLALVVLLPIGPARAVDDVRIAIVDSGIAPDHSEFTDGQVVAWHDFVDDRAAPYDDHGHGTMVASRAAGATLGVAPGTDLVVAKVLDVNNSTPWARVEAGIRWAADQQASVINVSIWSNTPWPPSAIGIAAAIAYATDRGALVVWAAGNGGQADDAPELTAPSTILVGANSPQALVVGAATAAGDRARFSQQDPQILATGHNVKVAWRTGGTVTGSGTSFAAPLIAGVAARMIEAGAPADPDWLAWVLRHVAADDPDTGYLDEGYGFVGTAAVSAAMNIAAGSTLPGPDDRDALHLATQAARIAQTGRTPVGAFPP